MVKVVRYEVLHTLRLLDDEIDQAGFETVYAQVKKATSDIELCYNLGSILDKRKEAIISLSKLVEKAMRNDDKPTP